MLQAGKGHAGADDAVDGLIAYDNVSYDADNLSTSTQDEEGEEEEEESSSGDDDCSWWGSESEDEESTGTSGGGSADGAFADGMTRRPSLSPNCSSSTGSLLSLGAPGEGAEMPWPPLMDGEA